VRVYPQAPRANHITDQSNARTVCLAHAVADAAKAAQGAVAACLEPNVMETAALESIEEAAMAAANAACMALVPATETAPTVATLSALVSNDRRDFYDAIQGMPDLGRKLKAVGVTFGANGGVEHTWTTTTLPALELAISKVKWLHRPAHVPRYLIEGEDSRGLPKLRIIDGTNMAETSFGELEKAISANGGYNEKKWQGLLLNKIGRLNERRRVQFCNISYLLPDRHVCGTRTPVLFRTAIMHASIDGRLTTSLYSHCRYSGVVSDGTVNVRARGSSPREEQLGLTSQQPLPAIVPECRRRCRRPNRDRGVAPSTANAK